MSVPIGDRRDARERRRAARQAAARDRRTLRKRSSTHGPKVVITHDFMETFGGAERVTAELAAAFPDAPVIALLARESVVARMGLRGRVEAVLPEKQSLLRNYRLLTPILPALADRAEMPECDVVVASSYAFAHRLRPSPETPVVCYCHSPLRFAWSMTDSYRQEWSRGRLSGAAFGLLAAAMRRSDRGIAQGVTQYLTQSPYTADLIEDFYGRDAGIVPPPVDTQLFRPSDQPPGDYYLLCGRLIEPYKRVGMVLDAFRDLPEKLIVAGDGPALESLRRDAPPNVEFLGALEDHDLVPLMQHCRGAVFPSQDDYGLIPVEVMATGRPVLAFGQGGALHTVRPGVTGSFFYEQTPAALADALRTFRPESFDPQQIRAHAEQWGRETFHERIRDEVIRAASQSPSAQRSQNTSVRYRTAPLTIPEVSSTS